MKLFLAALMMVSSLAIAATNTRSVQIGINGVFVPGGFDSTADAYVVVNGVFQNGCYRWDKAEVKDVDAYNHEVNTFANVTSGMCIMVLIPFQREVKLGRLASGKHNLKFLNGDGTYLEKTLVVE